MRKKSKIYKKDVGKIFKFCHSSYYTFELIYEVNKDVYKYYRFANGKWQKRHEAGQPHESGVGPYYTFYFEEINALTAIVIFGKNIPKEFKGWYA